MALPAMSPDSIFPISRSAHVSRTYRFHAIGSGAYAEGFSPVLPFDPHVVEGANLCA